MAVSELLREKSQIRFIMNCMLAIPALRDERLGAALFQDVFVGLGKWFRAKACSMNAAALSGGDTPPYRRIYYFSER